MMLNRVCLPERTVPSQRLKTKERGDAQGWLKGGRGGDRGNKGETRLILREKTIQLQ